MRAFLVSILLLTALPALAQEKKIPPNWTWEWTKTDFSMMSVDPDEVRSGGPPKDGIPAIDDPVLIAVAEGDIPAREPVVSLEIDGDARAYPVRYLMWHEIVNDRFGERPVSVTYCPLCNAAVAFDGRVAGGETTFGVSGKLRYSDMIMYDRATESWWQQFTGEAIAGERLGVTLAKIPVRLESWAAFTERNPDGRVMAEPENSRRDYGRNPYVGYDTLTKPWLYVGEEPPHDIPMMARVVVVGERAWPMERLVEAGSLSEDGVTLRWETGQASALDTGRIGEGREVGNVTVTDASGEPLVHDVTFAFVFHAFEPKGQWMLGEG